MNPNAETSFGIDTWRFRVLLLGAIAGLASLAGFLLGQKQFFQSYLFAWLFWSGISFGALVITMMQYLTGGEWGKALRPLACSALGVIPVLALLFVPIMLGESEIYGGTKGALHAGSGHKEQWLAPWFFNLRSVIYLGGLTTLGVVLGRWVVAAEDPVPAKVKSVSAGGLIAYMICMTFASTDWVMSLEPNWYSTMFVIIFAATHFIGALALMVLILLVASRGRPLPEKLLNDLGNLLLAFVVFWMYVSFSQFLIIWAGNLPKEISWYLRRREAGWEMAAVGLVVLGFGIPFLMLLSRAAKLNRGCLAGICLSIIGGNVLNTFWMVMPSLRPGPFSVDWRDITLFLTIGAIWFASFLSILKNLKFQAQQGTGGELG